MLQQAFAESFRAQGLRKIAGVDEVGRGPLAGPVVAAAVMVPEQVPEWMRAVNDSKAVPKGLREELAARIVAECDVGIGACDVSEIAQWNIRGAALRAMAKAVANLPALEGGGAEALLVDGRDVVPPVLLGQGLPQRAIIKGDSVELAVACASLVAKVHRDNLMAELGKEFPPYGWERNAGYGTAVHLQALREHGVTVHHRIDFAPVRALLQEKAA